jgi:hypothetical protein
MSLKHLWIVLGVATTAVALPATAYAAAPTHTVSNSMSDTVYPAGTYCDFTIERVVAAHVATLVFFDNHGNFVRAELHVAYNVTHKNLDTGYTLTESGISNVTLTSTTSKTVGVFWHLRDAQGKLVLVQAGQLVVDFNNNVIKVTPSVDPAFISVECEALGGQAA